MTKRYQVTGVRASFGPGVILELTDEQAQARAHHLRKTGAGRYAVIFPVEFKQGEIIQTDADVPKALGHTLTPLDADDEETSGFKIRHKGSGRYDVVDAKGVLVTDRLLSKEEAEALAAKLTGEAKP